MYIGACLMLLLIILQGVQIFFNPNIKDSALWVCSIALVGYTAAGVIDNLNIIQFANETASIIRLVFSLIVILTNAIVVQYNIEENQAHNINPKPMK